MDYEPRRVSIFCGVDIDVFLERQKKVKKQESRPGSTEIYNAIDQVEFSDQIDPGLIWRFVARSGGVS